MLVAEPIQNRGGSRWIWLRHRSCCIEVETRVAPKCHEQRLLLRRYLSHSESSSDAKFFCTCSSYWQQTWWNLNDRKFWEIILEPSTAFARHSSALSNLVHLFVRLWRKIPLDALINLAALGYHINLATLSVKPSPIDTKKVNNHKLVGKTVLVCNSKVINDTKVEDKVKAKCREMGQRAGPKPQGDLRFQY